MNKQIINEIKEAHKSIIINIKYYLDTIHKRDLIISISPEDNNIKIWNCTSWECILNFYLSGKNNLNSACILNNNNKNYIIPNNSFLERIKIYDFNGIQKKEIKDSGERTYIIESYKNYILTGNENFVKSYDFNEAKIYQKYFDNDEFNIHLGITIYDTDKKVYLFESNTGGFVRIWNFNTGKLLKKIEMSNTPIYGICLWNKEHLFAGGYGGEVILLNIKNCKVTKKWYTKTYSKVYKIKIISYAKLGKYLISNDDNLILWK